MTSHTIETRYSSDKTPHFHRILFSHNACTYKVKEKSSPQTDAVMLVPFLHMMVCVLVLLFSLSRFITTAEAATLKVEEDVLRDAKISDSLVQIKNCWPDVIVLDQNRTYYCQVADNSNLPGQIYATFDIANKPQVEWPAEFIKGAGNISFRPNSMTVFTYVKLYFATKLNSLTKKLTSEKALNLYISSNTRMTLTSLTPFYGMLGSWETNFPLNTERSASGSDELHVDIFTVNAKFSLIDSSEDCQSLFNCTEESFCYKLSPSSLLPPPGNYQICVTKDGWFENYLTWGLNFTVNGFIPSSAYIQLSNNINFTLYDSQGNDEKDKFDFFFVQCGKDGCPLISLAGGATIVHMDACNATPVQHGLFIGENSLKPGNYAVCGKDKNGFTSPAIQKISVYQKNFTLNFDLAKDSVVLTLHGGDVDQRMEPYLVCVVSSNFGCQHFLSEDRICARSLSDDVNRLWVPIYGMNETREKDVCLVWTNQTIVERDILDVMYLGSFVTEGRFSLTIIAVVTVGCLLLLPLVLTLSLKLAGTLDAKMKEEVIQDDLPLSDSFLVSSVYSEYESPKTMVEGICTPVNLFTQEDSDDDDDDDDTASVILVNWSLEQPELSYYNPSLERSLDPLDSTERGLNEFSESQMNSFKCSIYKVLRVIDADEGSNSEFYYDEKDTSESEEISSPCNEKLSSCATAQSQELSFTILVACKRNESLSDSQMDENWENYLHNNSSFMREGLTSNDSSEMRSFSTNSNDLSSSIERSRFKLNEPRSVCERTSRCVSPEFPVYSVSQMREKEITFIDALSQFIEKGEWSPYEMITSKTNLPLCQGVIRRCSTALKMIRLPELYFLHESFARLWNEEFGMNSANGSLGPFLPGGDYSLHGAAEIFLGILLPELAALLEQKGLLKNAQLNAQSALPASLFDCFSIELKFHTIETLSNSVFTVESVDATEFSKRINTVLTLKKKHFYHPAGTTSFDFSSPNPTFGWRNHNLNLEETPSVYSSMWTLWKSRNSTSSLSIVSSLLSSPSPSALLMEDGLVFVGM